MSYSILIVDDSATTRAMVKRVLRMTELPIAQLYEAAHGQAALDMIATVQVDLILADLNMPGMDGFEMTRRIRADQKFQKIPILVLSASPGAESFAKLEQVNGCLAKPFTPESIKWAITQVLEIKHD